jgi:hypothetical protein
MRVSTVFVKYPNEWVALHVRRTDEFDVPVEGEIVAHGKDRRSLHEQARAYRDAHPRAHLFIFFAGDPIPQGLSVCLASS